MSASSDFTHYPLAAPPPAASRPFAGKLDEIRAQHTAFWAQPAAAGDARAFLRGDAAHAYATRSAVAPPGAAAGAAGPHALPGWVRAWTPFTGFAGPVLAEDEQVVIVGNRSSFDAAQYGGAAGGGGRAGMSALHLLGLPKANLYNGVSLTPRTARVVDAVAALFRARWRDSAAFREAVFAHQLAAVDRREREAAAANRPDAAERADDARVRWGELLPALDALDADNDFTFGLHLWPDHSVAHLHVHILAAGEEARQYSTRVHDRKTKDAFEVRDYVLNEVAERPELYEPAEQE
ncbi:hypothetical protein GGS23DRAFT_611890 [Durotheca rogersii]|uniref:uncharacterized protein n=1 Tax=Durotheca rogersii TaxID=419775 RepID=UPI002220D4D5|nr:uncharacterized protein GGS23DRAFT_611890 [Durotheca rogersii]KAI5861333.1 hypothetical protein GGS23DRAFT_611890 [Durotheca rogersii]